MTNDSALLPFQQLDIYRVARELAIAVREADIRHTELRDQAGRASISAFLTLSEGTAQRRPWHAAEVLHRVQQLAARDHGGGGPCCRNRGAGRGRCGPHPAPGAPLQADALEAPRRMSAVSMAINWWARRPTRWASSGEASPQRAATSTAAAASHASPRAIVNARALSANETRPAPSAQLRQALFAE